MEPIAIFGLGLVLVLAQPATDAGRFLVGVGAGILIGAVNTLSVVLWNNWQKRTPQHACSPI